MGLSVVTVARNRYLTTPARVKAVAGIDVSSADLAEVTDAIQSFCNRREGFARQGYTELLAGFGSVHLQLKATPVVAVSAVTVDSNVVTDYTISEPERGWLYRRAGWAWTAQRYVGLNGGMRWLDQGTPLPGQEEPSISVSYTGGYLVPDDNVEGTGITADASDNSFNSSAAFPASLQSGDIFEVGGFSNAANNGRFQVSGTPTTSKVIVTGTLVTDAGATETRTFRFETLPQDIQRAAIETLKSYRARATDDSNVIEKHMGPAGLRYADVADGGAMSLPPLAASLLRPWVRRAA